MKGGYGTKGKETLRAVMREELRSRGARREIGIVETRCMGVCPKKAVTALNASRPGEIFVIPKDCSVTDALSRMVEGMSGGRSSD